MLKQIAQCLTGGGRIEIRGFGAFSVRYRRALTARNPRTGAPMSLDVRHPLHFKPGMRLRERVDSEARQRRNETLPYR